MRTEAHLRAERAYRERHRERVRLHNRLWREKNKEACYKRANELRRLKRLANRKPTAPKPEPTPKQLHERRLSNKRNRRYRERIRGTAEYRIMNCIRAAMRRVRERGFTKSNRAAKYLGCSVSQARTHIEARFLPGMSWENHGEWHIDHIKPVAAFDLSDPAQLELVTRWDNLQPLWAKDNLAKSSKPN